MNDVAATGQAMSPLRAFGVKLSIDDFGTGYSSLSYLRRFPVDTLKIDQSFVKTMDAENYAIVKTIVGLARNLDLNVVAEGVETSDQHQLLALAGCGSAKATCLRNHAGEQSRLFIESNCRNSGQNKDALGVEQNLLASEAANGRIVSPSTNTASANRVDELCGCYSREI